MHRDTVLYYFCYFDVENIGVSRLMLYFYVYVGVCVCVCVYNFSNSLIIHCNGILLKSRIFEFPVLCHARKSMFVKS